MARPEITGRAPGETNDEVIAAVKPPTKKRRALPPVERLAFTIQEFCDAHGISRALYYELKKLNQAPVETRVLDKILITTESAAAWRRHRTAASRKVAAA
jgi:hypothetical protein